MGRFRQVTIAVSLMCFLWIWPEIPIAADGPPAPTAKVPDGVHAADNSAIDSATGLPSRIIHEASRITLRLVPAGEFQMGFGRARHRRIIRRPFYLGETEVTNAQFRRFVEAAGYLTDADRGVPLEGHTKGSFAAVPAGDRDWSDDANWRVPFPYLGNPNPVDEHPVVHVSWNDAAEFCEHFGMRLPTEAEWEYAAWAGATTVYPWGDDPADGAGRANLADLARKRRFANTNLWFAFDDGAAVLSRAGAYKPNAWGFYDMIGNLEEWVADTYAPYPLDGSDESAATSGNGRVIRGRSWLDGPGMNRAAMQQFARRDFIGFRVALTVTN
jgi:formylglycine-generating enzyme required for sulfatase activity